jgi:hypothetical protein
LHECGGHLLRKDSSGGGILRLGGSVWLQDEGFCLEGLWLFDLERDAVG